MKRVPITTKPTGFQPPRSPEAWVQQKSLSAERIKRLTIDLPESLHRLVKSQCVLRGVNMADLVRDFLAREFGSEYAETVSQPTPSVPTSTSKPKP
jgi:hypothetical protein